MSSIIVRMRYGKIRVYDRTSIENQRKDKIGIVEMFYMNFSCRMI